MVGRAWRHPGTSAPREVLARCSQDAETQLAMTTVPRVARGKPARAVLVGRTARALAQGAAPQGPRVQVWRCLWCLSTIRSRLEEFLQAKACAVVQ